MRTGSMYRIHTPFYRGTSPGRSPGTPKVGLSTFCPQRIWKDLPRKAGLFGNCFRRGSPPHRLSNMCAHSDCVVADYPAFSALRMIH
jgi:hypothetical protein